MISTVVSTSLSIVREREKGTMEQIIVSPIHPMELIIGKTMPYVVISLISTSLVLFTGYLLFDVVIRGSILLLFLCSPGRRRDYTWKWKLNLLHSSERV